jgi:hypothetical protein
MRNSIVTGFFCVLAATLVFGVEKEETDCTVQPQIQR